MSEKLEELREDIMAIIETYKKQAEDEAIERYRKEVIAKCLLGLYAECPRNSPERSVILKIATKLISNKNYKAFYEKTLEIDRAKYPPIF